MYLHLAVEYSDQILCCLRLGRKGICLARSTPAPVALIINRLKLQIDRQGVRDISCRTALLAEVRGSLYVETLLLWLFHDRIALLQSEYQSVR